MIKAEPLSVGDKFSTDVFSVGDIVDVSGLNKGKGGPVLLSDITSIVVEKPMVEVAIVVQVQLVPCIHSTS
ncbi:MAG: hypothetical protein WDN66_04390 [Candidatus Saccharibacteria bacterium]